MERSLTCATVRPAGEVVVALLIAGFTRAEIARDLGMSRHSVRSLLYQIRGELGPSGLLTHECDD